MVDYLLMNGNKMSIFASDTKRKSILWIGKLRLNMDKKEQKLIRGLKNGDYKAFNEIYELYAKRLYAYCLQYTKQTEDAEEIVQDVFVRLWNQRNRIKQEETLCSLLFIMAKHLLINAYRAKVNHPIYEDYLDYADKLGVEDTRDRVEYRDFLLRFRKILSALPRTQQQVITLSRMRQLSNREIAEYLSLSEQTVKNQLSLGMKKLREEFDKLLWSLILFFIN